MKDVFCNLRSKLCSLHCTYLFFLFLLLSSSIPFNSVWALSGRTVQSINGSAPYFTVDKGVTKILDTNGFFELTLSDDSKVTTSVINSAKNPIFLPNESDTFGSVLTKIPLNEYPSVTFDDLVKKYNYWSDDDGDSTPTVTGNLKVTWKNVFGEDITNKIKLTDKLVRCDSPYTLTIESSGTTLATQYGVPNMTSLVAGSHTYYIKPKLIPYVCHALPNIQNGFNDSDEWEEDTITEEVKGFKVQSLERNSRYKNFPTIGSNNLFFKLNLHDITAGEVIALNNNGSVFPEYGKGVTLQLAAENGNLNGNILRVILKGPNINSSDKQFAKSGFVIYADNAQNILYTFELSRWLIPKPGYVNMDHQAAVKYCEDLNANYKLISYRDLTNADPHPILARRVIGINPGIPVPMYLRAISRYDPITGFDGGILNEWGGLTQDYYPDSNWEDFYYITTNFNSKGEVFYVILDSGSLETTLLFNEERVACVNSQ